MLCVKYFLEPSSFSVLLFSLLAGEVAEAVAQPAVTGLQGLQGQPEQPEQPEQPPYLRELPPHR